MKPWERPRVDPQASTVPPWQRARAEQPPAPTGRDYSTPSPETLAGLAGTFGPSFANAGTPQGEQQYREGVQQYRNRAADVVETVGPSVGVALGAPAGLPGMVAGGAVAGAASGRLGNLIRGGPEPSSAEKLEAVVGGATAGAVGYGAQKVVNVLERAFQFRPNVKLSFELQTKAKELDRAYRQANPGIEKKGFASPEAIDLWGRSKVVERLETAITRARGNPDRLRQEFQRLADDNKLMRRLTPEQQALILDVTEQDTMAGALRTIGSLRNTLLGGGGGALVGDPTVGAAVAGGQTLAGMAGRARDRAVTQQLVDRAIASVAGTAPPGPAGPRIAAPLGAVGFSGVDPFTAALVDAMGAPRAP